MVSKNNHNIIENCLLLLEICKCSRAQEAGGGFYKKNFQTS